MKYFWVLTFLLLLSCEGDKIKPAVDLSSQEDNMPDIESWNTEIIFSELGEIKAVLNTDHLTKFDEQKVTYLEGVKIDFFSETGVKTTTLTSKRGRVDDITKNMFAIDSVVVVSDSGVVLNTEELMWQNKIRKITSDRFVTIDSPEEHIEGIGFESDQGLENYKIYKITYSATYTDTTK